ncbi:TIGR03960 family B12-binding radical SAM protein [Pseudodesulfovibrio tunisiensis]|uniref:TIGR03960 family B12-binding radical SAM protein n=1 Tax=Pseudodesulfovibrio tunisiensis TaxID=463192 RepID=UPI001FB24D41|nr:TIGR03960 family B12-binding radical SAM protein [Pseudodesulfovibrio tunisiensis]
MKELLPILPRPARYLGSEWGVVRKDPAKVTARLALAFPDLYEVGMSYLGQKILAHVVNLRPEYWAERAYTPCEETAAILREHNTPLATLESDTPLADMDVIAFSLTHELCYTNILYMLDLAGIPLRAEDRDESHPLIVAGGGACFNAEPMAPFFDAMVIGDGENAIVELLDTVVAARDNKIPRKELLLKLAELPGMYIPSFFEEQEPGGPVKALIPGREIVEKAIVEDLNAISFPTGQAVPFGQAVHDRLTMEIARGCTRGCRFCQAGMIYRPVRERDPENLHDILIKGLEETGFEETSFLSLSTGDFSALDTLFARSFDHCAAEQISISLPSLRVGSLSAPIMERISSIRRTGATIAPEAGSQRMRDVINKGITEPEIMDHVQLLFENGWQSVKLYFMIGLPTETDEDLDAILDLCTKVRQLGRNLGVKRLQITAAVSPFVPKSHTPFQWEAQIDLEEIQRRIGHLRDIFRQEKQIRLKYHEAEMSFLEGIFSRGDRRLAEVVERAYKADALFSSWKDHLQLEPYMEAMRECGLDWREFLGARDQERGLPWSHLHSGLSETFLRKERERALSEKITQDCRYHACRNCGVCNFDAHESSLENQAQSKAIHPRIVFTERDQEGEQPPYNVEKPDLTIKGGHYRLWFTKLGPAAYLSQLELQSVFERTFRRARLPLSFSAGFHPMPRISFGMALPVGVESRAEWLNIFLREDMEPVAVAKLLKGLLPEGIDMLKADRLSMGKKQPQQVEEVFRISFADDNCVDQYINQWMSFRDANELSVEKLTKKGKVKKIDLRAMTKSVEQVDNTVEVVFDWRNSYMSPLTIARAVMPEATLLDFSLVKTAQRFDAKL